MTDRIKRSNAVVPPVPAAAIALAAAGCTGPAELSSAAEDRTLDNYFERLDRQSGG